MTEKGNLFIASLNCRGLSIEKAHQIYDLFKLYKIDILLIQETHICSQKEVEDYENIFYDLNCNFPLSESKKRGVGILSKNELFISNFGFWENRILFCDFKFKKEIFTVVNIYAPNGISEQVEFIEEIYKLGLNRKNNLIFGGDFNCEFERIQFEKPGKNLNEWLNLIKVFEFENIDCSLNKKFTWLSGARKSNIDRFLIKKDSFFKCECVENIEISKSDHNLIICKLSEKFKNKEKMKYKKFNEWKLNDTILDDPRVHSNILIKCYNIPNLIAKYKNEWYEVFVNDIIYLLQKWSRQISGEKKEHIFSLYEELNSIDSSESEENKIKKEIVKNSINEYYNKVRKGAEKRACEVKRNFVFQPSKILIEKELRNSKNLSIEKYKTEDDILTENKEIIMDDVFKFYNNLLGKDRIEKEKIVKYEFNIKKLDDRDRNMYLDYFITFEEAQEVVSNMQDSAPGPNGLTIKFYKKYFEFFGRYFVDLLNRFESPLSDTFNKVTIKLIPKNKNQEKTIKDLRPISLTNFEYRIFTKILTNRLRKISNLIIEDHQTCSIIGRRMNDNIILLRDLLNNAIEKREQIVNIICGDQEKAFDMISHNYVNALLDHVNFGSFMTQNIKRLYASSFAHVTINKIVSDKIEIRSGIKQGCALSMFLYVLAIEELLIRIKKNANIRGYKINILENNEFKVAAYADDVVGCTIDDESTEEFFKEFESWGKISGAKLNKFKTEIIKINQNQEIKSQKILGIEFDNFGIKRENVSKAINKIKQAIAIWNKVNLSLLERVIICKTFLLSKIWFVCNFIILKNEEIKEIKQLVYNFVWNSKAELVNRNTLILPYESGGMGMFNIEAKIKTILFQQFLYICNNYKRIFYSFSIYWLKFLMRNLEIFDLKSINFNNIPSAPNNGNIFYARMRESVNEIKKYDPVFMKNLSKYNSKNTYIEFRKTYEVFPKCKSVFGEDLEWDKIFKNINNKKFHADLRSFNYKIIVDGISLGIKIKGKLASKCFLCDRGEELNDENLESREHLLIKCVKTQQLFNKIKHKFKEKTVSLNEIKSILHLGLQEDDSKLMSIFNLSIWILRNRIRVDRISNIDGHFIGIFKGLCLKYKFFEKDE